MTNMIGMVPAAYAASSSAANGGPGWEVAGAAITWCVLVTVFGALMSMLFEKTGGLHAHHDEVHHHHHRGWHLRHAS